MQYAIFIFAYAHCRHPHETLCYHVFQLLSGRSTICKIQHAIIPLREELVPFQYLENGCTRWFNLLFLSSNWRPLSLWKGQSRIPKRLKNCQAQALVSITLVVSSSFGRYSNWVGACSSTRLKLAAEKENIKTLFDKTCGSIRPDEPNDGKEDNQLKSFGAPCPRMFHYCPIVWACPRSVTVPSLLGIP